MFHTTLDWLQDEADREDGKNGVDEFHVTMDWFEEEEAMVKHKEQRTEYEHRPEVVEKRKRKMAKVRSTDDYKEKKGRKKRERRAKHRSVLEEEGGWSRGKALEVALRKGKRVDCPLGIREQVVAWIKKLCTDADDEEIVLAVGFDDIVKGLPDLRFFSAAPSVIAAAVFRKMNEKVKWSFICSVVDRTEAGIRIIMKKVFQ